MLPTYIIFSEPDVRRAARTDSEAAIVLKANVEVVNVHALLQTENVTQMFVGIVGSGES
jgi:hypothetical protein